MKIGLTGSKKIMIPAGALGLLLALSLILSISAVPVMAQPAGPHQFWGYVTIDGAQAPVGTQVYAQMDGIPDVVSSVDAAGLYGDSAPFRIEGSLDDVGKDIDFYVGGSGGTGGTYVATAQYDPLTTTQLNLEDAAGVDRW